MDFIIDNLQKFGFSKMEGNVYITLLKNPEISGYKIGKILAIPRSTVYACLDNLHQKGAIYLIPGNTNTYKVKDVETFFENLKKTYVETVDEIKDELKDLTKKNVDTASFFHITGYDNCMQKMKELLLSAEEEVYINLSMELQVFKEELKKLAEKNVKVIIFCQIGNDHTGIDAEIYENKKFQFNPEGEDNILMVVDLKKSFVGNGYLDQEFAGTYSENRFFVYTISNYIHLDIYNLRLEEKYKSPLIDEEIKINSKLEQEFKNAIEGKK